MLWAELRYLLPVSVVVIDNKSASDRSAGCCLVLYLNEHITTLLIHQCQSLLYQVRSGFWISDGCFFRFLYYS